MRTRRGAAILLLAGLGLAWTGGVGAAGGQKAPPAPAFTMDVLDRLFAPIALYPDELLSQMVLCAATPAKVTELQGWLKANPTLKGTALQDAAVKQGFQPSFVALALFPDVVAMMAKDLAWTTQIGQAFATDRNAVFGSIQRLRAQGKKAGVLKSTPQQQVETRTTSSGEQVTVIEPANPQVVYVPQYNPQVVYTTPPATTTTTTVVVKEDDDDEAAAAAAGAVVGFAAGVAIGAAIDNDYYYGPYGWHGGGYMYNDAWDDREDAREDYYEHREDAREDYYENRDEARDDYADRREDVASERGERSSSTQQQRTTQQQTRQENRSATQAERSGTQAQSQRSGAQAQAQGATTQARTSGASTYEARGSSSGQRQAAAERSGTKSDAFSGYSSGKSERAASSRGQRSRSSSGGGRSRRR